MQLQPKIVHNLGDPVLSDATAASQPSGPATVASLSGSPVAAIGSPALALQQQLVERMAQALDADDVQAMGSGSARPAKLPISTSLVIIFGASTGLWLMIGAAAAVLL